jgi:hypothetical protein
MPVYVSFVLGKALPFFRLYGHCSRLLGALLVEPCLSCSLDLILCEIQCIRWLILLYWLFFCCRDRAWRPKEDQLDPNSQRRIYFTSGSMVFLVQYLSIISHMTKITLSYFRFSIKTMRVCACRAEKLLALPRLSNTDHMSSIFSEQVNWGAL